MEILQIKRDDNEFDQDLFAIYLTSLTPFDLLNLLRFRKIIKESIIQISVFRKTKQKK